MPKLVKRFEAKLGAEEPGELYFAVPFDVKATFGAARPKVKVTVNRHTYRSTVSVYGGRSYVPVRRSNREAAGVAVGDLVQVALELDTEPRVVDPPPALAKALRTNARARAAWEKLGYSHKKEHADAIAGAKKPETSAARVKKAIAMLTARS